MKLKTFTAEALPEALAQVRKTLGPGAVVLHTRTYRRGGMLGLGGRTIVEVTATDRNSLPERRGATERLPSAAATTVRPARRGAAEAAGDQGRAAAGTGTVGMDARTLDQNAGALIRKTYALAQAEMRKKQSADPANDSAVTTAITPTNEWQAPVAPVAHAAGSAQASGTATLMEEMRAVQRLVAKVFRQQVARRSDGTNTDASAPDAQPLFDQYLSLLNQEMTEEIAEDVVSRVRRKLSPAELDDAPRVLAAVREAVASMIPTDPTAGNPAATSDGRPRVIALIGPTGVGKTTTIAKLAATFKIKHRKNVGLITMDTFRIAAVDQLKVYANIIGVPLHVVSKLSEMEAAMRAMRVQPSPSSPQSSASSAPARCACDVILIDTAGRSQRDDQRLVQLGQLLRAADPHEVHLVLSSTCTQAVLMQAVERFSAIRTDRIIFTKLDEAVSFGVLVNVARKANKRLSYITTGQEVPHQIEAGGAERLADLVTGGRV